MRKNKKKKALNMDLMEPRKKKFYFLISVTLMMNIKILLINFYKAQR